jgi:hypothetical protein
VDAPLAPGTRLDTVQVGPPIGGLIAIWRERDRSLWRVDDPEQLASDLGHGRVSRTLVEPNRFREVGLFADDPGVLVLTGRVPEASSSSETTVSLGARQYRLEAADAQEASRALRESWLEFARWLGEVLDLAAGRGEFVVVEGGGWDHAVEPYFLGIAVESPTGLVYHLESSMRPREPSSWPPSVPGAGGGGVSASAPATSDVIRAGGHLAVEAVSVWARTPHDLGITFGSGPTHRAERVLTDDR